VLKEVFKAGDDVLIAPGAVLKLDHQTVRVDHREVLQADLVVFDVVEELADDAHDLLVIEEVQDLGHVLDDVQLKVTKLLHRRLVVR
jgi:hypothetical protein